MEDLNQQIDSYSVSSILNRDTKQYGKKYLFDNEDDTCWNSDQGKFQHVIVKFQNKVCISEVQIQFQGGFSCKQIDYKSFQNTQQEDNVLYSSYPEDVNNNQIFKMEKPLEITAIRIKLLKPTDFFGRVIIYHMKFLGYNL